ncbi:hypothetical protein D9M71_456660 [compost metagenome]
MSVVVRPKRAAARRSISMRVTLAPSCRSLDRSRKAGLAFRRSVRRWVHRFSAAPSLLLSTYWYWLRVGPELRLMSWPARR